MPPEAASDAAAGRPQLVARWLDLTRRLLPGMAAGHDWPIRLDHCFMRVCLDAGFGRPWHECIARPAIRHATDAELARVIAIAEGILREPGTLPALNAASLRMRGKAGPRLHPLPGTRVSAGPAKQPP